MDEVLSMDELEQLLKFRLTLTETTHELNTSITNLMDEKFMRFYMKKLGVYIGSPNEKVTASIFVKRYAFLTVIFMYGITVWNKKINTSLGNTLIQSDSDDGLWLPKFYLLDQKFESPRENREVWREQALKEYFSKNVYVILDLLSKVTKQSKLILWENIAIYLFWLYESILQQSDFIDVQNRAREDFDFLFQEAQGNLFGPYHNNPLKRYDTSKSFVEHLGETVRIRKTCCFSYLLEGDSMRCKTCPQTCNMNRRNNSE